MSDDLPVKPVPAGPPQIRISDADRSRAIDFLRHHCTEGRLTLDEFSDRITLVFEAKTGGDLDKITADLPARQAASVAVPQDATAPAPMPPPALPQTRRGRAVRWTVSIFSSSGQRGRWRIEGETNAVAAFGDARLDLRQAEVVGPEATINAFAFMGGVDIVVPEGFHVELTGFTPMGGKHLRVRDVPTIPGSPIVRVHAIAFMGGVTVRSKPTTPPAPNRERHGRRGREARAVVRPAPAPPAVAAAPAAPTPAAMRGIEAVAREARDEWPEVRARIAPEGTVTIMFSDIEGFTPLTERLGDYRANGLLQEHYRLVRDQLQKHSGFEVKVHGDGFMVAFSSASRALRCARAIQNAQAEWNEAHPEEPIRVRMGLHTGEAIRDADDFLGTTVNLASRIATSACGGQILVSGLLRELCLSSGEFEFDDGQDLELKGLSQQQRVYAVSW